MIYSDNGSSCIFSAIVCFVFLCLFGFLAFFLIRKGRELLKERSTISGVILFGVSAIWVAGAVFSATVCIHSLLSYAKVCRHDFSMIEGNVQVRNIEEQTHRGDLLGYTVELTVDGKAFSPETDFPREVVTVLESGRKLRFYYLEEPNGAIDVYEITDCE